MQFIKTLRSVLAVNTRAYTAIVVGSVMGILIGAILLLVTYLLMSAILTGIGTISNAALNTSLYNNITVITQALTLVGISLIIGGTSGILYMLFGVAGNVQGKRGK